MSRGAALERSIGDLHRSVQIITNTGDDAIGDDAEAAGVLHSIWNWEEYASETRRRDLEPW